MITELTEKQKLDLEETYKKWLAIGRRTDPIDRDKATTAIGNMYKATGKPKPTVLFFSSPLMCMFAYAFLKGLPQLSDQLRNQLRNQLSDQLGVQLGDQLWDQLRDQLGGQLKNRFGGNQWCAWEVFYDFCNQIGVKYTQEQLAKLDLWINQSMQCHWWFPYDGIVLASDHPRQIHIDSLGRLHNYDGLAIEYSDGWGVTAFHGVRVSEKYATTKAEEISVEEVLKESSSEVRMVVLGKIGLSRALGKIPHKVISSKNGNDLIEFTIENKPVRGLLLRWSDKFADKTTVLPVPRTLEEFKESFCDDEYPEDFPDDVNDCEQVRISTFRGFIHQAKQEAKETGKHWMECIEFVQET